MRPAPVPVSAIIAYFMASSPFHMLVSSLPVLLERQTPSSFTAVSNPSGLDRNGRREIFIFIIVTTGDRYFLSHFIDEALKAQKARPAQTQVMGSPKKSQDLNPGLSEVIAYV